MKRMISIIALLLAPILLLTACAMPAVKAKTASPADGHDFNADYETENNENDGNTRVWPWEDPSITLPEFTGTVTAAGTIKSLKILAIGDASARDALYYVPELAKEAGITDINVTVLYINGNKGTLDNQWSNWNNKRDNYTQYENKGDGWVTVSTKVTAQEVLQSEKWDYCILNQSIANSGIAGSISASNFGNLVQSVSFMLTSKSSSNPNPNYNAKAKLLWLQTWAYEINSRNNLFNSFKNYNNDQQKMYEDINSAIQSKVITNSKIKGVIPVGTAIQNLRESYWSDGLTKDAEYLSNTGKVAASVAIFKYITGYDINGMTMSDPVFDHARPHLNVIKESANNAYLNPYAVTPSVYDTLDK